MRQCNLLKQSRTIKIAITRRDGNPETNVISSVYNLFEHSGPVYYQVFSLMIYVHAALGPPAAKTVHAKEKVDKKRFDFAL